MDTWTLRLYRWGAKRDACRWARVVTIAGCLTLALTGSEQWPVMLALAAAVAMREYSERRRPAIPQDGGRFEVLHAIARHAQATRVDR